MLEAIELESFLLTLTLLHFCFGAGRPANLAIIFSAMLGSSQTFFVLAIISSSSSLCCCPN